PRLPGPDYASPPQYHHFGPVTGLATASAATVPISVSVSISSPPELAQTAKRRQPRHRRTRPTDRGTAQTAVRSKSVVKPDALDRPGRRGGGGVGAGRKTPSPPGTNESPAPIGPPPKAEHRTPPRVVPRPVPTRPVPGGTTRGRARRS